MLTLVAESELSKLMIKEQIKNITNQLFLLDKKSEAQDHELIDMVNKLKHFLLVNRFEFFTYTLDKL